MHRAVINVQIVSSNVGMGQWAGWSWMGHEAGQMQNIGNPTVQSANN